MLQLFHDLCFPHGFLPALQRVLVDQNLFDSHFLMGYFVGGLEDSRESSFTEYFPKKVVFMNVPLLVATCCSNAHHIRLNFNLVLFSQSILLALLVVAFLNADLLLLSVF